jgi:hypothetical protein
MVTKMTLRAIYETRNIPRYSRQKNIYRFISKKNQCTYYLESYLEFCYCFWLEFLTNVARFKTQPARLKFIKNLKKYGYTPDFLIYDISGQLIFDEVKPLIFVNREKIQNELLWIRALCYDRGIGFKVTTDEIIYQPGLESLKELHRYSFQQPSVKQLELVHKSVDEEQHTLVTLLEFCHKDKIADQVVFYSMFKQSLIWPLAEPLSPFLQLRAA